MAEMLGLKPEDEKSLHPEALKWFNARRAEIQFEVPLEELSDDDLNTFLSDDEKREFIRCKDEIAKGLYGCINKDDASPDPLTNASIGLSLLTFEVNSLSPMYTIRLLLKKVYQRKAAKAEAERRKREEEERQQIEKAQEEQRRREEAAEAERRQKEEEERWQAAYKVVSPPINDAKRYLNDEEYDKFIQAVLKAIEVYLGEGEDYLDDVRTFDYRRYLRKINFRKEEERRQIAANVAANEYNRLLNKEKARLKALLCPNKKDHESYFKKQIKDCRYTSQSFAQFLSSEEEQDLDRTIVNIGRKKLDEIVSGDFRQFIEGKCWRSYFLLPSAEYSLEGVPCLDFMFDVFAIVEVRVWFKPGQKKFGDYVFNLPWREGEGYPVVLQEPEFLGYHYLVFTPKDLGGYSFWQSIPLVLLKGLLSGETKPNGITISAASDGMITYKIPKFKEEVNIPDNFASYLRSIGSIDEMVNMGIVTEKVASVAKSELGELKVEQQVLPSEGKTIRKDSKKARAFVLFSQGRRPSDPEVQALGVKPETTYRYHQEWKKAYSNSHNTA